MPIRTAIDATVGALIKKGRAVLHESYPRDFEVYMNSLELVSPLGDPIDHFTFPIMPNSITKTEAEATSIQQSMSGVTVYNKTGFIPKDIVLQGDFGRAFKFTNFENDEYYRGVEYSISKGYYTSSDINNKGKVTKKLPELPNGIKSGYGCIKILQSIIDKAKARDAEGRTFKLYYYNPALGESYLVVPKKNPLVLSQNVSNSNMVWQYTLNLLAIADLNELCLSLSQSVKEKSPLDTRNILKFIAGGNNPAFSKHPLTYLR